MTVNPRTNSARWPALLDLIQGLTGLILVFFVWAHVFMVSSILLGKDAMYWVARMFEGEPIFGRPYPILVSLIAAFIIIVFVIHAIVAIRKIPSSYEQFRSYSKHSRQLKHSDTSLWILQVVTGLGLMFLASGHLYQMLVHPADIGPYASSDRIWSGRWWPIYLLLLFTVQLHGNVGVYRLALKWGWFTNKTGHTSRRTAKRAMWGITAFFLILGLCTLAAEMKVGYEHRDKVGERYQKSQPEGG